MKRLLLMAVIPVVLLSCYPAGPEYVEDLDVTYTTYNQDFDFQSRQTYAMPDKIVVDVDIEDGDTTWIYMKDIFATPILAAIDDNLESRGWTKVDISDEPNVVVTPGALSSTTYFYSYWYDWWYGGYYGGWGWYYPPSYTISSYTTGSMIITMSDPNVDNDSPINQSQTAWVAVANGLLTDAYDISRVTDAIDEAFEQSPYLKLN
ncbi:MAG TPA: DUF4136 domain-containing protein [Chryseolinea sp.]|nr:DUF4136 domain-containing protein [Chryseolinea sp.]